MFQASQKHVIGEIDKDSPAHRCDLHQGEVLLRIDQTCVMKKNHRECVAMIK